MKFFHLSDLHIGRRLKDRSLREVQEDVLKQIAERAESESPDAVVIAGDVFDRSDPSPEAVSMFDQFITDLTTRRPDVPVMIVSGNHDSAERIDLYRHILRRHNVHVAGRLPQSETEKLHKVTLEDEWGPVNFYLLPHVRPYEAKKALGEPESEGRSYEQAVEELIAREHIRAGERSVLVAHQFVLPVGKNAQDYDEERRARHEVQRVGNSDAISARVLEPFSYAALGHIHRPMDVAANARYCGTPLAYSTSEAGQDKSISMVELKAPGQAPDVSLLPLEPLHRVRILKGRLEEILAQASEDFVEIVLTDDQDLNAMDTRKRIFDAFRNVLEYRHEKNARHRDKQGSKETADIQALDPLSLCIAFLEDGGDTPDEQDRVLLADVIGKVEADS